MFGNLFSNKKLDENTQQGDNLSVPNTNGASPQPQAVVETPVSSGGMDPVKRQNVESLTHLDARANQVLQQAQNEAKKSKLEHIEPDLVLLGLLYDKEVYKTLNEFGVNGGDLARELSQKQVLGAFEGAPTLSVTSQKIFDEAFTTARNRGSSFITPEDLLLALFNSNTEAQYLSSKGIQKEGVEKTLSKNPTFQAAGKKSVIEQFGIDLTQEAKDGKLDPVVGRDKEIERLIHILLRRTKNNPIIIGEAGVGKTAVIEALAQKIVEGSVPEQLKDKKIIQLDLAALIAGASRRGEFEERLKNVIKEVQVSGGKILLFIDEIHTLIGAGEEGGGAMDASNIIKPYLARGQLQLIGTTTTAEFRKYFEKDKAFQRRFQSVIVDEPDEETAQKMLEILKSKYENYHSVTITPDAIKFSVTLSKKYVGERYLPDKAIDLLDEAAAEVKLMHAEGKRQDTEVKRADIEKVVSDWTGIPITRLTEDEGKKLLQLEDLIHKRLIDQEEAVAVVSEAVRRGRIGLASANRPIASFIFLGPTGVGKTELAKTLAEILFGRDDAMVRLDMSEYMEKHEVAKLIGAPPGYVGYEEGGQLTEAVRAKPYSIVLLDEVEKAHPDVFNILLQLLEDGRLTDNKGNTISFKNTIVIATSNIGSTTIQEALVNAKEKGDKKTQEESLQNFTNSSKDAVSQVPQSQAVREQNEPTPNVPNSNNTVVTGAVESSTGAVVSSTGAVTVVPKIAGQDTGMQKVFADLSKKLMEELTKFFRPELVNRFDGVVIFKPLRKQDMKLIAKINISKTAKLLKEQGFNLEISDKALEVLGDEGFDPVYGARPLRRLIQNAIENPISIQIISQKFIVGDTIKIDYDIQKQEYTFVKVVTTQQSGQVPVGPDGKPIAPSENGTSTNAASTEIPIPQAQPGQVNTASPSQGNGMVVDPYTPIQNPMAPAPFSPFTADENKPPEDSTPQPTLGSDGTQMQPDPTQTQ
jgi:ATP-dependent Clp protease ATP-binding subunit ClpC